MEIIKTEEIKKWEEAGRIAAHALNFAKKITKQQVSLLEIAEKVEEEIEKYKAKSAFPINLSINEIAAHSSPAHNDKEIACGLLKIDIGVSMDGYISDNAASIDLTPQQEHAELIKAAEEALHNAIKLIRPGIKAREVGRVIQETISEKGFAPIINLSGHEMKRWDLHAGLTIPNYDNGSVAEIQEGMILAIEPFATTGQGIVIDGKPSGIYKFIEKRNTRDVEARKILEFIENEFHELPFSSRWLVKKFGTRALISLKFLEQAKALHHFNQLIEKTRAPVAQAEATVLVTKNGCKILTKEE